MHKTKDEERGYSVQGFGKTGQVFGLKKDRYSFLPYTEIVLIWNKELSVKRINKYFIYNLPLAFWWSGCKREIVG